jgi:hypothetical protein
VLVGGERAVRGKQVRSIAAAAVSIGSEVQGRSRRTPGSPPPAS